jgi:hypothetical protein
MAILKKRTSSKQIPEARALNRAPLNSIIQGVNKSPSISGGSSSLTSTGSGSKPSLSTQNGSSSLTSSTGSKPAVTNTTSKTPTSITTSPSTVPKQTVKPKTTNPNSTTSKIVNALSGAAIGAGTKLLVDKFSSKPNVSKTPAQVAAENKAKTDAAARDKAAAKAKADAVKPKAPPTSVVTPPVTNPRDPNYVGPPAPPVPDEFITDAKGNIYQVMPDGTEVLYRAAEVADEYMTDSLGNIYKTMPDGSYELYHAAEVDKDTVAGLDANQIATLDPEESAFVPEYFEDSLGNIYISTPDGEYDLYRAAEVEDDGDAFTETPYEPEYFEDSLGNIYMQGESGEYELYRAAEVPEDITEEDYDLFNGNDYNDYYDYQPDERYATQDDGDEYYDYKRGGLITMMNKGGVAKFEDGGYVDNGDGTYSIGNFTYDMMTDEYLYSTDSGSGNISNVNPDAVYSTDPEEDYYDTDSLGNIYRNGEFYRAAEADEDITSSGGGNRNWYDDYVRPVLSGGSKLASDALSGISGALGTTAGAAGAGALVATLLGQDFSGGTGEQNQGLDMSKVGVINPRTTDFGIGPTKFVGYEDYGTGGGDYAPNEELLRNLNAPGFNPVREGDYGYEEVAAEDTEEAPKMASGGLSSMATPVASYYTFGQPADILANLGMRPQPPTNPPEMMPQIGQQQSPQQTQQQGLPQQAPPQMAQQAPQGMPQQGIMPQQQGMPPPMRKGGLPHASNVPMVEGRMDFRRGSAVHGEGDGQSDDIPAMLADGEYVIDAETVAQIGNGSTKAGAQALDKFREGIRAHKRSAPINKIPPKTKALTSYLKGAR